MRSLAVVLACIWLTAAAFARDRDAIVVAWTAPATCPSADAVRSELVRKLGADAPGAPAVDIHLTGRIEALDDGYTLELRADSGAISERRNLSARDCGELARAAVLIASLIVVPPHAAAREPAQPPATSHVYVRAALLLDLGTLPSLAAGPVLALGYAWAATSIEIGGLYLPSQAVRSPAGPETLAHLQLWAGSAGVCHALLDSPLQLGPCLRVELGRLSGRGQQVATPQSGDILWLLAALGVRAALNVVEHVAIALELSAGLPWDRAHFDIQGLGEVHRVSSVIGRMQAGVEVAF